MSNKILPISELTCRPFRVNLNFDSITHAIKANNKQTVIIDNASGSFQHGKLHAIMGPSGCGKSSLLNVLSGFNPVATGTLSLNGAKFSPNEWPPQITPVRSYILQNDFLVNELTVNEQLTYSVELKVPNSVSEKKRRQIVTTLLKTIHLEDCANRYIGVLSGGQRKRVCVASELVNYQPVLFLDEPTTGLDSTSCYRLVEVLKSVARSGCNVIATIHQPNSRVFSIFDTLTVLYNGGVIAYSGPAAALAESLQRLNKIVVPRLENPAEILFAGDNIKKLALVDPTYRGRIIDEAAERARSEALAEIKIARSGDFQLENAENLKHLCTAQKPSSVSRFRSLFKRTLIQTKRDVVFTYGRIIAYICTAALVGLTYQGVGSDGSRAYANTAFLFIIQKIFTLGTCILTIMNTQNYLEVLLHESINSLYGMTSFYIVRTIIEAVANVFISFVFSIVMWLMSAQQVDAFPTVFKLACLTTVHCIGIHHFSFIIAMFSDKPSLPQLPFAIIMIQVISAGFFIRQSDFPVWFDWVQYVNFGSYTYAALLKLAYATLTTGREVVLPCNSDHPLCKRFRTGIDVLHERGINPNVPFWHDLAAVGYFCVGLAIVGWALIAVYLRRARREIARL